MRWVQRIERLLAREARQQWQLEHYRRAAEWVALRLPAGAVTPGREREQQSGAPGGGRRGGPKPE